MQMFSRHSLAALAVVWINAAAGNSSALAVTLPASGVDTRAIAAGHYHGYEPLSGANTPPVYSGNETSRAGTDSQYGGVGPLGFPITNTGSYSASASLYDGKLRAMAAGSSTMQGVNNYISLSRATASLQDTVFFAVPPDYQSPPGFQGILPITAMIHLDGTSVGLGPSFENDVLLRLYYGDFLGATGEGVSGLVTYARSDNAAHSLPAVNGFRDFGGNNYGWTIAVPLAGSRALTFRLLLEVTGNGGIVDYSNTAAFSFVVPSGVSFTSQSGVFLTGAAVPEPASWALMIIGFGLTGGVARRRKRGSGDLTDLCPHRQNRR